MAAPMTVCLFIPQEIISDLTSCFYSYGYCQILKHSVVVNCISVHSTKIDHSVQSWEPLDSAVPGASKPKYLSLGILYSSDSEKHFDVRNFNNPNSIKLKLRICEIDRSFHLEYIFVRNVLVTDVQVIVYDAYTIIHSQLLPLTKQQSTDKEGSFISFLLATCSDYFVDATHHRLSLKASYEKNTSLYNDGLVLQFISWVFFVLSWSFSTFYLCVSYLFCWCPQYITNTILWTATGQQFYQRYLHFAFMHSEQAEKKPLSIKSKNVICAILIDVLCGYVVMQALLKADVSDTMLDAAMSSTNDLVSGLTNLINWLMGAPAGLKLNIPLNNALGKFFLYHIYLWESYMMVVQPVFALIFKASTVISICGLTFILSLVNDLISLATIHIYCFYGYAARLYGYQVKCLAALWRLFRGKKWNPLRQRIDSYTYDVHQLYLGTLIFTVLLFLLPTVMIYYFVFTCLRILVLVLQGILSRVINILTICPLYSVVARTVNSAETTGDVYFSVFNSEGVLTLSMKVSQISYKDVIRLTVPDLKIYHELLTWKEIMSSIAWGKIIYPL